MSKKAVISALKLAYMPQLIEAFLASKVAVGANPRKPAWTASKLGRVALNDAGRVFQIRNGMDVMASTAQKIVDVIDHAAPGFSEKWVKQHAKENLYED